MKSMDMVAWALVASVYSESARDDAGARLSQPHQRPLLRVPGRQDHLQPPQPRPDAPVRSSHARQFFGEVRSCKVTSISRKTCTAAQQALTIASTFETTRSSTCFYLDSIICPAPLNINQLSQTNAIMVWGLDWITGSGPSQPTSTAPRSTDGGYVAPDRSKREVCYESRDLFFKCLDRNNILDAVKEDEKSRQVCPTEVTAYERDCARSWVSYSPTARPYAPRGMNANAIAG